MNVQRCYTDVATVCSVPEHAEAEHASVLGAVCHGDQLSRETTAELESK
jgi:hypothetical protein